MTRATDAERTPWASSAYPPAATPGHERPANRLERSRKAARWSFRIATIFGIDLNVHATFVLLLVWIAASHLGQGHDLAATATGVGLVLAVFTTVVLHELAHALTARRFGIRTHDIMLLPIGGVASLERMPDKPSQELLVALAGPALNIALALALAAAIALTGGQLDASALQVVGGPLLPKLMWINVSLAVFNLLPAFPMDGGRALRALLALRTDYLRATELAARIGQGMALMFGALGLFLDPMLILIAFFVWTGARTEASLAQFKSAVADLPIRSAMVKDVSTLAPDAPLARAAELILVGFQHDFPVLDGERLVGVLTQADLLKGLTEGGRELPVASAMRHDFATAEPNARLESALEQLREDPTMPIVVTANGRLLGLLALDNIGELVLMQRALSRRPRG